MPPPYERELKEKLDQRAAERSRAAQTEGVQKGKVEVRDPETGQYLPGNTTGGRTEGTKEAFHRSAFKAMVEIIAGRLREAEGDSPISEKMAKLLANPAIFLRALHEYMQRMRDRALKKAELAKKEKGTSGGIRIVLAAVTAAR